MYARLWAVVNDEAQRYKLGIAPNCEDELKRMIEDGINRVRSNPSKLLAATLTPLPSTMEEAEDQLRSFVRAMAQDAIKKGYPDLHEDTFAAAKLTLCPGLWPFC